MKKYIFNRIIQALICLFFITIIVFALTHLSGDPVMLMVPPEGLGLQKAPATCFYGTGRRPRRAPR